MNENPSHERCKNRFGKLGHLHLCGTHIRQRFGGAENPSMVGRTAKPIKPKMMSVLKFMLCKFIKTELQDKRYQIAINT